MKVRKNTQNEKRLSLKKIKQAGIFALILLLFLLCVSLYIKYQSAKKPDITTSFISGKLEAVSELTTAELIYRGLFKYSEGDIPFLTKNSFSMIYTATIRAGIDISEAEITVTEKKVTITLPEDQVQSVDVDMDSIEFYDEKLALFNWTEKQDIIDAVSVAKEDVLNKADIDSLLENARQQTETIIRGLLADVAGDRELVIQ